MLANYIEPAILNKIFLINTLLEFTHSDFSELVQITGFSNLNNSRTHCRTSARAWRFTSDSS